MRTSHEYRNTRATLLMIGCVLAAFFCTACTPTYTDYNAFITNPTPQVTAVEYRMAPPDMIGITSKRVREINGHSEVIRTDGRITLPLLGSVYIAGMTAEEASAELEARAREFYSDADVTLRIRGYASKKIYVFGEVSRPGAYPYHGANTILATIAAANPNRLADPSKVQVLRPNRDGQLVKRMTIDVNRMMKRGDTTMNALLQEDDILYVPPTPVAEVGLALQHLLLPIQPAASLVGSVPTVYGEATKAPYETSGGDSSN